MNSGCKSSKENICKFRTKYRKINKNTCFALSEIFSLQSENRSEIFVAELKICGFS